MNILLFISFGASMMAAMLVVAMFVKDRKKTDEKNINEDLVLRQAKRKSNTIIQNAIERADKILAQAHLQGADHIAHHKKEGAELEEKYQEQLERLVSDLSKQLEESEKKAEEAYAAFLEKLAESMKQRIEESRGALSGKSEEVMKKAEEYLAGFIDDIHEQIKKEVTEEVKKTRASLEEYKRARMKSVNENIIDILEIAYKKTLGKALSIKDQADLAYQALEQAKRDGFFKTL